MKLNKLLNRYAIKPQKIKVKGKATIVETDDASYVIKKQNNFETYNYLNSRNFDNYPKIINKDNEEYEVSVYLKDYDLPSEQKMLDLVDTVALLHYKTTYYREVDEADYKQIYEDLNNNLEYLYSYYNDYIAIIESKIFMSPSEYLLARNISLIYRTLNNCKKKLEVWYKEIPENKERVVLLHNNLHLDHFVENDDKYLVSWSKAKIGNPIFDLYKLYNNHVNDFDFKDILERYEQTYPLLKEEKDLLKILIQMPQKIDFNKEEYEMCFEIGNEINRLYKTEKLITVYFFESEEQTTQ